MTARARSARARWRRLGTLLGLVLVTLVVIGGWGTVPRYRGKTVRYWFPIWGLTVSEWEARRQPDLQEAGPELAPVLVAALQDRDSWGDRRLAEWVGRAPPWLHAHLPRRFPERLRREAARGILLVWAFRSAEHLGALSRVYDQLPWDCQVEVCARMGRGLDEARATVADELLRRVVGQTENLEAAAAAALALARAHGGDGRNLGPVASAIRALPARAWADHRVLGPDGLLRALAPHTTRLGELGVEPGLLRWLAEGPPRLRAAAVLLLPFVAPERHPVRPTIEAALPRIGGCLLFEAANLRWFDRPEQAAVRREFMEVLAPLFYSDAWGEWGRRWKASPEVSVRAWTSVIASGKGNVWNTLPWLADLGPDAAPAAPHLTPWLGAEGDADWRRDRRRREDWPWPVYALARTLARIGPVAPETLPGLVAGLTNELTAAPVVLLLAAYGPAAGAAESALRAIAEDRVRFAGDPGFELFARPEAVAHGFPDPADLAARPPEGWPPSRLRFGPALAVDLGLTNVWPRTTGEGGAEEAAGRCSLSELAAEALRRIRGGGGRPRSAKDWPRQGEPVRG